MGRLRQTFMLSLQILINICILLHVTPIIVKSEFLIVKRSALIGFARILDLLIGDVMTWKEKKVRKQVLRGRAICRDDLLNREQTLQEKTQVTFNLTYYSVFKDVRKILKELHLLLTPDQVHKRVFSEVPIIRYKNTKSLKDHLVRTVLPQLDRKGRSKKLCEGPNRSCVVCDSVKDTAKFKKAESEETFDILKGPLDCNSNNVIYVFEFKKMSV